MSIERRLREAEKRLGRGDQYRTVAIVCEDESGQWTQDGEPVTREDIAARQPGLVVIWRLVRGRREREAPA